MFSIALKKSRTILIHDLLGTLFILSVLNILDYIPWSEAFGVFFLFIYYSGALNEMYQFRDSVLHS